MVLITRVNLTRCKFSSSDEVEIAEIHDFLSIYVDGAHFSPAYKKGDWDGYNRFYDKNDFFDYGILEEMVYNLDRLEIKFKYIDYYKRNNPDNFIKEFSNSESMRYYQNDAIAQFFKYNMGIIVVPTRGGKTYIASDSFKIYQNYYDGDMLFIVDTTDLFDQSVTEIASFLGIPETDIGTINDKGLRPQKITVGMIQTIVSHLYRAYDKKKTKPEKMKEVRARRRELEKYLFGVKFLIVDEVQEYSSKKRQNAMKKCKSVDFLMGLSATPFKQDDLIGNLKIKGFFGSVVYEIPDETLQKEGYLALDKIFLMNFTHAYRKRPVGLESFHDYLKFYIHENRERNNLLKEILKMCKKNGWKTLVLFNSKQHGNRVSELTGIPFISGDDDKETRNKAKKFFLRGRGKILMASNIWKKGITLPEAQLLIIADGGYEGSGIIQKRGRVLGAVKGKTKAGIIDIMDVGTKYFSEHSLNRLEVYSEKIGDDRIEVIMEDEISLLQESLKDWLDD